MPKKLERCIRKIKSRTSLPDDAAYPICIKSTGQKPHRRKRGK